MVEWRRVPRGYLYLALLLLAAAWVFLVDLGAQPLRVWDEGMYASISRHVLESGHWLVPRWFSVGHGSIEYRPWLKKPPLIHWLQAVSIAVFGPTAFAVRLPTALAAVATTVVVYVFGRDLGGKRVGLFSGAVYLTTPYVYAGQNAGRTGGTDPVLVLFGTLFVYYTWRVATGRITSSREPYYAVGAAVLAFLTKGVAAGIFVIVLVPLVLARWRTLTTRRRLTIGVVGVAAMFVWPVLAYIRFPEKFVRVFIRKEILNRILGQRGTTASGTLFEFMKYPYFHRLPDMTDPWGYFGAFAVALICYRLLSEMVEVEETKRVIFDIGRVSARTKNWLFVSWWFGAVVVFFAFTGNHPWYLLPAFVPLALVIGWMLDNASRGSRTATVGIGLGAVMTAIFSARVAWQSPINQQLNMPPGSSPVEHGWSFVLALGGFLFLVVLAGQLSRPNGVGARVRGVTTDGGLTVPRVSRENVMRACLVVSAIGLVVVTSSPAVGGTSKWATSQIELGHAAAEHAPPDATIYIGTNATARTPFYTFRFYAGRDVAEVERLLTEQGRVSESALLVLTAADVRDLRCPQASQYHVLARGVNRVGTKIALVEVGRGCRY